MRFTVLTLFPEMFEGFKKSSMIGRAIAENRIAVETINFRNFTENKHKQVDDAPFGGGGMVIQAQPLSCLNSLELLPNARVVYMTPKGRKCLIRQWQLTWLQVKSLFCVWSLRRD